MKIIGVLTVAAAIVLSALPAAAQGINLMTEPRTLTPEEKQRRFEREKAYEEKLKSIPDQKMSDPWARVRGPEGLPAKKKRQDAGAK
jgi:hypothetical protein